MSLLLSHGILGQVWYLNVSIPDLCTFSYFVHVIVLWLFLRKPWVSLIGVILVFLDHINLIFH